MLLSRMGTNSHCKGRAGRGGAGTSWRFPSAAGKTASSAGRRNRAILTPSWSSLPAEQVVYRPAPANVDLTVAEVAEKLFVLSHERQAGQDLPDLGSGRPSTHATAAHNSPALLASSCAASTSSWT